MRKAILGAASALALASPAVAADLPVTPYSDVPSYERHTYEYRAAPPVIITDERDDEPLRRPHIDNGKRFLVPNSKIKWDSGNPTGHGIIFIGHGLEIHCYLPPGGG
jgi:opacity protein-like surface antigen